VSRSNTGHELINRRYGRFESFCHGHYSLMPGRQDDVNRGYKHGRDPAPIHDFQEIRRSQDSVDAEKQAG
jgi:hypothetical protein